MIVHDNMKYEAFGEWKKIEIKVANKEYLIEKGKTVDVQFVNGNFVSIIIGDESEIWKGE